METSLVETLGHSALRDLATETTELTLDSLLKNGFFRKIPIVRSLVTFYETSVTVRDHLFTRKIMRFVLPLSQIPEGERENFVRRLDADEKLKRNVGENLILLLDRLDDMSKPEIVGDLFKAYMLGRIQFDDFQRLATAVERMYLPDLFGLRLHYEGEAADEEISERLALCGLLSFGVDARIGGSRISYTIN